MARRIIVTDMDDTMIKSYGTPTHEVRKLWNSIKTDNEIGLVIATGQSYTKVKETFSRNDMLLPDFIICNQGTVIYSSKEGKVIKKFIPDYEEVVSFLEKYVDLGGDKKYIRISTPSQVVVFDCKENRKFYEKNIQGDVVFRSDFWDVISEKEFTKIVCAAPEEVIKEAIKMQDDLKNLLVLSTGKTKFGNSGYSRVEITASNKRMALEYLLYFDYGFPESGNAIDMLCLGDELSDLCLAEVAININNYPESNGTFAIISNDTIGNNNLRVAVEKIAKGDEVLVMPGVEENGWVKAVNHWLKK